MDRMRSCSYCGAERPSSHAWCAACGTVVDDAIVLGVPARDAVGFTGEMCRIGPRDAGGEGGVRLMGAWLDSHTHSQRARHARLSELQRQAADRGLPPAVVKDATSILSRALDDAVGQGRLCRARTLGMIGAALFHACKDAGAPRTTAELARGLGMTDAALRRACMHLEDSRAAPVAPVEFLGRIASALGLSEAQKAVVRSRIPDGGASNPLLMVAACVLDAGWPTVDAARVAWATGFSAGSLEKAVKRLHSEKSVST